MKIAIRIPSDEKDEVVAAINEVSLPYQEAERKGLSGVQVLELIFEYGPTTLAIIEKIIDIVKKLREEKQKPSPRITIDIGE